MPAEEHGDAAAEDVEPRLLLLHHPNALPAKTRLSRNPAAAAAAGLVAHLGGAAGEVIGIGRSHGNLE